MTFSFVVLHYIVGLADQADALQKKWEEVHFDGEKVGAGVLSGAWDSSHSSTNRLIYSATKAFAEHGDEAAGCIADFKAFLESVDLKAPLSDFRGNRNCVIFHNGAGVLYLHEIMLEFLVDVYGETNRLLKDVKADLCVPELIAGCRALGLISKFVISPLGLPWKIKTGAFST